MRTLGPLLLLPLLLLTGCFDYAEDLWVHADRSVELKMAWGYHEEVVEDRAEFRGQLDELARLLEEHEEVTKVDVEDWQDGDMQRFSLLLAVTHYEHLEAIFDQACANDHDAIPADDGAGKTFEFVELDDGSLRVTRQLDTDGDGKAGQFALGSGTASTRNGEGENPFAGKVVSFRFHAPRVLDAEDDGDVSDSTAEWRFPLDQDDLVLPRRLRAQLALTSPFPWGLALAGAFGLGGFVWLRKQWSRRWE